MCVCVCVKTNCLKRALADKRINNMWQTGCSSASLPQDGSVAPSQCQSDGSSPTSWFMTDSSTLSRV